MKLFLEKLNIPPQAWMATGQVYMKDPQAKAALEKAVNDAQTNAIVPGSDRELMDR